MSCGVRVNDDKRQIAAFGKMNVKLCKFTKII